MITKYSNIVDRYVSVYTEIPTEVQFERQGGGLRFIKMHFESYDDFISSLGYDEEFLKEIKKKKRKPYKRVSKYNLTIDGETKSLIEWCEIYGVNVEMVRRRIRSGWDAVKALQEPCHTEFVSKRYRKG